MNQRPNILLIMSDEHDPAVTGCYGHPLIETPHLDRLASEGTTFDNAYTACPICVPARMSFMTGQYVHQIGTYDNGSPLAGTIPTMGSYLEAAGYETAVCGRTHFIGPERLHGFGVRLMDDAEKWKHWSMSAPSRTPTTGVEATATSPNAAPAKTGKSTTTARLLTSPNASSNPARNTPTVPSSSTPAS